MNGELIQAENKPSSISSIPAGTLPRQLLLPVRAVVRGSRTLLISRNESFTRLGAPVIDLLQPEVRTVIWLTSQSWIGYKRRG